MDPSERRRHDRLEFSKKVRLFSVEPSFSGNVYEVNGQAIDGKVWDISRGGLRLAVPGDFKENTLVKLHFEIEKERPLEIYGKVVWRDRDLRGVSFLMHHPELQKGLQHLAAAAS